MNYAATLAVLFLLGCSPSLLRAADGALAAERGPAGNGDVIFSRDIQPLISKHCLLCHGPDEAEGGVRLDVAELAAAAADSGARAIVPGDAEQSELLRRVTSSDLSERMPPDGEPLSDEQVSLLRQWIEQGAEYEPHWSYRPVRKPGLPSLQSDANIRNPIDRFVLARLEQAGIDPSPEADRTTLIRRLYYDLLGLPPTPQEVDAFVRDSRPAAYERLVDRLLASPHFGERWGRHWLDRARYADSDGYEKDRARLHAWLYRDWVLDAINRDLPFDRFTIEQLAGDLLPEATPRQRLATAFHRQTLTNTEGGTDQEEFRVEATFDRTETTAAVWMGLTMTCARCHTHKYDQITHREYYQLFAFFNSADEAELEVVRSEQELVALKPEAASAPAIKMAVLNPAERTTTILERGDFLQPAKEVASGVLEVLSRVHPLRSRHAEPSADRLDLARWLVDPQHPLVPRVAVNDVWARLFGSGIVATVEDFGVRGDQPSHPELLDWLAWNFPRSMAWSRKSLIRTIVLSATYRQASVYRPELQRIDPANRLLARQNRVRVEAEIVRDLHLAASGLLSHEVGGPSVFPPLPPGVAELSYANNFKWRTSSGGDGHRRGMYTFFKRTAPHPNLVSFDCPDSNTTSLARESSNTPLQALTTLNNQVFVAAAQAIVQRVIAEGGGDDRTRLAYALQLCIARTPRGEELDRFHALLETAREYYAAHPDDAQAVASQYPTAELPTAQFAADENAAAEHAAWVVTLRMVMNLDEFLVRD
ncbi:PSD1 and planctomycete cytochrome C domain-containing protein [Candidatus Laterigemmans baculatus]|uniref:PSD1 and planctomycete cytochrome C domain-containing protein n=1 Tax=Candidatus Laterigemmans baculatus TaxID=2770505 RepID=UPI0013DB1875|nr:PSD1 and planctomycete cytochrome C domain-containing protein [Candidatus Laterigemmans baculatus]